MLETVLTAISDTTVVTTNNTSSSSSSSCNDGICCFGKVDAESASATELTELYGVVMVPTVLLLTGTKVYERLEGEDLADPSALTLAVQRLAAVSNDSADTTAAAATAAATTTTTTTTINNTAATRITTSPKDALHSRLAKLVRMDTVVIFIKGSPSQPRCGFSRQAVELLAEHKVPYASFDILEDNDVRQGLKEYSDWPTYPQIYVRGELMGGLDILKETASDGNLLEDWDIADLVVTQQDTNKNNNNNNESLDDRLAALVKRHPIMLFMKGLPSNPRCGFSRQTVELLDSQTTAGGGEVSYDAFDILSDEEVRQGLKAYSDWPTYPQLYVNGELVGGLDILRELHESGDLEDVLRGAA
eukprot:jgi/Psemu1/261772/estExt_Genewise1Plus.C_6250013